MVTKEQRRKRDAAHELASAGWLNSIREKRTRKELLPDGTIVDVLTLPDYVPASRTADLGARVRAERDVKPIKRSTMDRKRKAKMKALKERLNAVYNSQRRGPYQWPKDESRYFPHQGEREMKRRSVKAQLLSFRAQMRRGFEIVVVPLTEDRILKVSIREKRAW
jgi:hypothetical protein